MERLSCEEGTEHLVKLQECRLHKFQLGSNAGSKKSSGARSVSRIHDTSCIFLMSIMVLGLLFYEDMLCQGLVVS